MPPYCTTRADIARAFAAIGNAIEALPALT
jgi:hypothetical protein